MKERRSTIGKPPRGWEGLLGDDVPPAARAYRARWVLALDEAASIGRAATWEEWNRIWFGRQRVTYVAAVRALVRLKRELRRFGVKLHAKPGDYVYAGAWEVRDLVEPWVRRARVLEERLAAAKERREPELTACRLEARRLRAAEIAEAAGPEPTESGIKGKQAPPRSYAWLKQRFGIGHRRLSYLLSCKGAARAPSRRRQIEDQRSWDVVERALARFDGGGTVRDVADELGCSTRTAWLFLQRQGREVSARRKRAQVLVAVGVG